MNPPLTLRLGKQDSSAAECPVHTPRAASSSAWQAMVHHEKLFKLPEEYADLEDAWESSDLGHAWD